MGYYLNIIRKKNYADWEEDSNISMEEWLAYIELDEELELQPEDDNLAAGFCRWLTEVYEDTNDHVWFDYGMGCIGTKNPNEVTIHKMIRMANVLQGKVQGDDGEIYDDRYLETGKAIWLEQEEEKAAVGSKKPWWKIW
ncbi:MULTISPECIES: hypothetical protein [unclassified Chitinophaga]|uniref:hypothetical protein n=1 Tax=unclassified Chitinophaga TaxID=2619133 RepID=UPI00117C768D|nr:MULTISPECIES: hypothetical protein [unclassified Chitinophaga]WPV66854.1 hypothetical protein QQL36_34240 [Chitinophaga sp. LS1]